MNTIALDQLKENEGEQPAGQTNNVIELPSVNEEM